MVIKMVALGIFGQKCYLGDTWNRLDFFIVMAGSVPSLILGAGESQGAKSSWQGWEAESPRSDFFDPHPKSTLALGVGWEYQAELWGVWSNPLILTHPELIHSVPVLQNIIFIKPVQPHSCPMPPAE